VNVKEPFPVHFIASFPSPHVGPLALDQSPTEYTMRLSEHLTAEFFEPGLTGGEGIDVGGLVSVAVSAEREVEVEVEMEVYV
jgi:hypothetical protein